jgi:hypothetical protein
MVGAEEGLVLLEDVEATIGEDGEVRKLLYLPFSLFLWQIDVIEMVEAGQELEQLPLSGKGIEDAKPSRPVSASQATVAWVDEKDVPSLKYGAQVH